MSSSRRARWCLLLSLIGLGLCAYLGFLHIALLRGELLGGATCGGAGSVFNCHAVIAGRFGSAAGLPLWVWGAIGYLAAFHLCLVAIAFPDIAPKAMVLLTGLAIGCVLLDGLLLVVMVTQIKYLCPVCLLTYLTNLLMVVAAKRAAAQSWGSVLGGLGTSLIALLPGPRRPFTWVLWSGLILGVSAVIGTHVATAFVSQGTSGMIKTQVAQFVEREPRVHVETVNSPAKGASNARVTLVEFSDFFCPACQKASKFNTIMLASHRHDVRLVFKHFPLDTTCNDAIGRMVHPGACQIAAAAVCADQQGKFWPLHDVIFEKGHDYDPMQLTADAQRLGMNMEQFERCVTSGQGMEAVRRDVAEGKQLGISSTPTFFVNGLKMPGIMIPAVFEALTDLLGRDGPSGVVKAQEGSS